MATANNTAAHQAVTAMLVAATLVLLLLLHHPSTAQKGKDADAPDGIQCYTCGLETVDPHLDKVNMECYSQKSNNLYCSPAATQ